jgi:SAM-dependent methyltransferase
VLEVGCGAGYFLSAAQAAGFEAWGTEISSSGLSRLAGRGFRVLDGELPKLGLPAGHFDAVVLIEVVEHLREPGVYLAEVRRVLREGGALLLTTPNFGSLSRRLLGNRWRIITAEHLVLFSPQGIRLAISAAGLHLLSVSSRNIDPLEIIRALRSQPYGVHVARQARVDAIRSQIYGKTWLRAGMVAANRVLNVLELGDTLEARACR